MAAIAAEYRPRFRCDVVVDLIGYRRHGHSEVDDPTVTQPRRYALIKDRPPLYQIYAEQIGVESRREVRTGPAGVHSNEQKRQPRPIRSRSSRQLPTYWDKL